MFKADQRIFEADPRIGGAVRLSDVSEGRNNNLNLIRLIAALAVLVSHAWPITLGPQAVQPLQDATGFQLGTQAVYVFFAISGFLIARSYERRSSVREWALARVLRIFPGLAVALVASVLVLGPLATALPLRDYLATPRTWSFVPAGLSLFGLQHELPGVFGTAPVGPEVNGSLWTLQYEVLCYLAVLAMGLAGGFRSRVSLALAAGSFALASLATAVIPDQLPPMFRGLMALGLPFACGVAFHIARRWLPLIPWVLAPAIAAVVGVEGTALHQPLYVLTLAYATFLLAYLPRGWIRRYNAVGDYSYGIYIYAWPVQQAVVQAFGPMEPLRNILVSAPIVLALAWVSWNVIERPALRWMRPRRPA